MKSIIRKTLITEKNTIHNAAGVYVFEVDMDSSKPDIQKAVEKNFKVKVDTVRTAVRRGRGKATKKGRGKPTYWPRAYVKLAAVAPIALFEGV